MKYDTTRIAWMVLLVTTVLGAAGCTGSDPLDSGNFLVTFPISREGTVSDDWDCVMVEIRDFTFTTIDGTCEAGPNLGTPCHDDTDCGGNCTDPGVDCCEGNQSTVTIPESVALLANESGKFQFTNPPCPTAAPFLAGVVAGKSKLPTFVLPSGYYRVDSLRVGAPLLATLDFDQTLCTDNTACSCTTKFDCPPTDPFDRVDLNDPCSPAIDPASQVSQECGPVVTAFRTCFVSPQEVAPIYAQNRFFRVGKDQPNMVPIVVDLDRLEAALPSPGFSNLCGQPNGGDPTRFFDNIESIIQIQ